MTNTYAVAKAATPGIEAPASPMMIKENSPGNERGASTQLPTPCHSLPPGSEHPGGHLGRCGDSGQGQRYRKH